MTLPTSHSRVVRTRVRAGAVVLLMLGLVAAGYGAAATSQSPTTTPFASTPAGAAPSPTSPAIPSPTPSPGWGLTVVDAAGHDVVRYEEPQTDLPMQRLACPYIAAARRALVATGEVPSLSPTECVPALGERVTAIATGVKDLYLALVVAGEGTSGATASLYSFRKNAGNDLAASTWVARCPIAGPLASRCYASLVFVASGTRDVDAAIASALGLPASHSATGAAAPGCPTRPWTLASIVSVPSLPLSPSDWPVDVGSRAGCFGSAEIPYIADGGMASAVIPGVVLPPALGSTVMWYSSGSTRATYNDFQAVLPPSVGLTAADRHALEMTSPGRAGPAGWGAAWWRVSGHFDDAAAADCESGGIWYLDDTPIDYTTPQAVEVCRNLFVIDTLAWLPPPPTDTVAPFVPARVSPFLVVVVTAAVVAAVASLRLLAARDR